MKLNDILSNNFNAEEWEAKGYQLPQYDIAAVAKKTHDEPTWVHFGAGNIFRAFPAAILNEGLQRMGTVSALVRGSPDDAEDAIKAQAVAAKADYYVIIMIDETIITGQWYSQAILYRK